MALLKKEPEDLYRRHESFPDAPISKGKSVRKNKGYDPEVRRARYLKRKAEVKNEESGI